MATLVLGAVGSAIGGAFGGAILGFSGAAIGGFIGSTIGSVVDNWIVSSLGPAQRIEGARLDTGVHVTAGPGAEPIRTTGRLDNLITDADGSELPFAAICTSGRSADEAAAARQRWNVRYLSWHLVDHTG